MTHSFDSWTSGRRGIGSGEYRLGREAELSNSEETKVNGYSSMAIERTSLS